MASDPRIRASDEDRDRAAAALREHHAVGRLDAEEFTERLDQVYQAKTMGQLHEVLADLPGVDLYLLPGASLLGQNRQPVPGAPSLGSAIMSGDPTRISRFSPGWRAVWGSWLTVNMVCFVVWAVSGFGYPWPLWVAGPWGAILLARWLTGGHPQGGRSRNRHR
jgi:hypothetical protein